ncbi:xylose transport system permease protein XylH [Paraliobacillus ryukyuensis]|uniref:Xylose transport system permease protein XylH n=1 Tax=Paraliobacillus ryukyuensis TaxID=200904 RepID=A0A366EDM1_9BACI|nr:multiple monosaccharide ABC transporter permease [Paraliobacillus ryukyuensis]RBP00413.1 multiple monosaccharide ABC transporter membrane protein [Paraliobacillus ryukyuensis]
MNQIKLIINQNIRKFGMIIALVGIALLFQIITSGILLTPLNVTNIIMQNSYIIILGIGMALVIITGEIDLSVGSVAAFIGAISAMLMINYNIPVLVAIALSLLVGAIIGAWHGFWVAYVNVPAFIVTLAGMLLFRGLTLIVLGGKTLAPFPDGFRTISSDFLPDYFSNGNVHLLTMIIGIAAIVLYILNECRLRKNESKYNLNQTTFTTFMVKNIVISAIIFIFTYILAIYAGIPYVLLILLALIIGYSFFMNKTVNGRHIYAVGGNKSAAQLSGIKTRKVTFWVFVNMGVLAALAGLVFAGRLNAATPQAGELFELDAIAAAVIGGASLSGGVGTVAGAVIGALIMGILNNGMSLMGVGIDWQQAVKGLVLLSAVAFDIINKNKAS